MSNGADTTLEVTPDHGLSGLGLLVQLVGGSLAVLLAGLTLLALVSPAPTTIKIWLLLVLGLGSACGVVGFSAGRALTAGDRAAAGKLRTYIFLAWGHTALATAFLATQSPVPFGHSLLIAGTLFGVWPTFLFVVASREPYRGFLQGGLPETPDRGAEGLSIYMSLFGGIGVLFALYLVQLLLKGEMLRAWQGVLVLISVLLLLVRSGLHVNAGVKGTVRRDLPAFREGAERYALVGNIIAFLFGACWTVLVLSAPRQDVSMFIVLVMTVGLLLVWPTVVRRFVEASPAGSSIAATEPARSSGLAPDRGLTALGWLLLSMGVVGGAFAVTGLILGGSGLGPFAGVRQDRMNDVLGLVVIGLEIFAGLSLVRLTPTWKVSTLVYAGVGTVVSVISVVRQLDQFRGLPFVTGDPGSFLILPVIMSLVIPIGSGLLVLRAGRQAA